MNPLDEQWRIGSSLEIETESGQFVLSMTIEDCPDDSDGDESRIDQAIALVHHIIAIHNVWLENWSQV